MKTPKKGISCDKSPKNAMSCEVFLSQLWHFFGITVRAYSKKRVHACFGDIAVHNKKVKPEKYRELLGLYTRSQDA